jgi:hypothetical protein
MDAFANRPQQRPAGQCRQRLERELGDDVVELADQPLIRAEHDGADRTRVRRCRRVRVSGRAFAVAKARAEAQFHAARIVAQRAYRLLVLPDARRSQRLHGAYHRLEIPGAADLAPQTDHGVAHGSSAAGLRGLGLEWCIVIRRRDKLKLRVGFGLGVCVGFGLRVSDDSSDRWARAPRERCRRSFHDPRRSGSRWCRSARSMHRECWLPPPGPRPRPRSSVPAAPGRRARRRGPGGR